MNAAKIGSVTIFLVVLLILTTAANSQSKKCTPIGGVILTDLGVPDGNSSMGYATGDLKDAVGVTILSKESQGNTLILTVQHHWVSESGDIISLDPATVTNTLVSPEPPPGLYAVVTYPFTINGNGTGKFAGVSGDGTFIGEADLSSGRLSSATPDGFAPNSLQTVTQASQIVAQKNSSALLSRPRLVRFFAAC